MIEMSVANAGWFLRPETQAIFAALNRDGFEVRVVGGAVRNTLMNRETGDVDFATTAKPADIVRLADAAGLKSVPTGIDHGTVTLIANGVPFEVTSLRRDVETDGRRAVVHFGGDWASDAARRDFTMNALYAGAGGRVHDPLGGLPDLLACRVRFIGEPRQRIREDYLRILRFFRFSAEFAAGDFDTAGITASIVEREGLSQLSRERVRAEMLRILVAKRAENAIQILDESGILQRLLAGVCTRIRFERLCSIETALQRPANPILRLAALTVQIEEDAARLADRLRLSSAEEAELKAYSVPSIRSLRADDREALTRMLYHDGPHIFCGRILLRWAEEGVAAGAPRWRDPYLFADGWERPKFPINGADLIALGMKPGPKLGETLKALEDQWIRDGFTTSRDTLLALASFFETRSQGRSSG